MADNIFDAALSGNVPRLEAILDGGVSVNSRNESGCTALHLAAINGQVTAMAFLLDRGADLSATNTIGRTALHLAAYYGYVTSMTLLLDRGADLSATDDNGKTALDLAQKYCKQAEVVKFLQDRMRGATASTTKGRTSSTASTSSGRQPPSRSGRGSRSGSGVVLSKPTSSPKSPSQAPASSSTLADLKAQLAQRDLQLSVLLRGVNSLAATAKCDIPSVTSDSSVKELAAATQAIEEVLRNCDVPPPLKVPAFVPELPLASVTYEHNQTNSMGGGRSGDVYGGRLTLDVAVKVVRLPSSSSSSSSPGSAAEDAFKSETASLCCLTHPNIVRLHGVVSEARFIVMERMEESLSAEIAQSFAGDNSRGGLAPERLQRLSFDIARGMAHLHACGYVHRDLKPSNVLIDGSGRAKVSGFGLARGDQQREGALTAQQGTIGYMSPEVLNEELYGPPSDVYAFGMTLYHMLSGKAPWSDLEMAAVLKQVTGGARPPIYAFMDEATVALAERCWVQAPQERPTFAAIVAEMERA